MAFVISRQSTTGLLILTNTDTGKIVSRAETPWDLVNIAVEKGAVPADQRQELITQGQVFVQEEDSKQAQQNTAQSAGQEVKQSGDAGVTNPAPPTQTFTSPEAATTATQPDPVVAESNSNTPAIGVTASPSPDATASVVQTNAEEAVPQSSSTPGANSVATRERSRTQSYVFYATTVTSEFRQGRFEQTLEGSLYIFPRPKTAQVVDPPVKAADLGSQSFGLTDNPRVNPGKKKVASAQDARKATIGNQTFWGQGNSPGNVSVGGSILGPQQSDDNIFGWGG